MTLEALRIFVCVTRVGSFSKAAVMLGVTQPTVSRAIADLEQHFGSPLFYRTGRGVALTDLGDLALPRAQALVRGAEDITEEIRGVRDAPSGLVSIGVLPSSVGPLVVDLHDALRRDHPGIRLRVLEGFSNQVERWLSEGEIDIGLLSRYRPSEPVGGELLGTVNLVLVGGETASLPPSLPFRDLAGMPLVLPAPPNGLRLLIDETAQRMRLGLPVVIEADSLQAQVELVRHRGYFTVGSPQVAAAWSGPPLRMCRIVEPDVVRRVVLVASRDHPLSRASRVVIEAIRRHARRHADRESTMDGALTRSPGVPARSGRRA